MPTFEEVQPMGAMEYVKPKDLMVGETIEGVLVDRYLNTKHENPQTVYRIFTVGEELIGLNGTGQLDYLMARVDDRAYVRLTYLGKNIIEGKKDKNGNNVEAHQFKVEKVTEDDAETLALKAKAAGVPPARQNVQAEGGKKKNLFSGNGVIPF